MNSTLMKSTAFLLAAFFAVSATVWDQGPIRDDLMDDFVSPWCRLGSLDSWAGRPCAIPLRTGVAGTADSR